MMKKVYQSPVLIIEQFSVTDLITTETSVDFSELLNAGGL